MILQHLKSFDTDTIIYALVFQLDFFNGSFDFHCLCVSFSAEHWLVDKRGGLRLPAGTEIETLRSQPANLKELLPEGGRGGGAVKCKVCTANVQCKPCKCYPPSPSFVAWNTDTLYILPNNDRKSREP